MSRTSYRTGWHLPAIGLAFLMIGLGLVSIAVWMAVMVPAADMPWWLRAILLAFACLPLAAAGLGVLLLGGGTKVTIDAPAGVVLVTQGLLVPWSTKRRALADFRAVQLSHEIVEASAGSDDHSASASHPIRLMADDEAIDLAIASTWQLARTCAESIAERLQLPLIDASDRETVTRLPGEFNESLAARLARSGESPAWPSLPRGSQFRFFHRDDATVIDLPPIDGARVRKELLGVGILLTIWIVMTIPGVYAARAWFGGGTQRAGQIIQGIVVGLPLIAVLVVGMGALLLAFARERVVVSPRRLLRVWRWPVGRWTWRLDASEIEELRDGGDDVIVVTDRTRLRLGLMLAARDRRWLADAVRWGLCNGVAARRDARRGQGG